MADLMDAIHNIPELVRNWERCDVEHMREAFFGAYDRKWSVVSGFSMRAIFDRLVSEP